MTDTAQNQFEAWATSRGLSAERFAHGGYVSLVTDMAYAAWRTYEADMREELIKLYARLDKALEWEQVLLAATVSCGAYRKEFVDNPQLAVQELILQEQRIALDPLVSKEARDLERRAEVRALEEATSLFAGAKHLTGDAVCTALQRLIQLKE